MNILLIKAELMDASEIYKMQIDTFKPLLEKYQDYDISPANETMENIINRLNQPYTDFYLIKKDNDTVGAIRIVKRPQKVYRVSPLFIIGAFQGQGIAQKVFTIIESMYADAKLWQLDTILQEEGNCHLYEKLGYKKTGKTVVINDKMTIIYYEKKIQENS